MTDPPVVGPAAQLGAFGTVAGLVGQGWHTYVRILHPAWRDPADGRSAPVRWADVARLTGRSVDLSTASWHDVSGVRPHQPGRVPGVDREPVEGDGAGPVVATLVTLLAQPDAVVSVAEWDGYGRPGPELPTLRLPGRSYRVHRLTAADMAAALRAVDDERWPRLVANLTWLPGQWTVAAEVDAMSTYVGAAGPVPDLERAGLEWRPVRPGDPVS